MNYRQSFTYTLLVIGVISIAFLTGYWTRANQDAGLARFPILNEAYQILATQGLKDVPAAPALEYGMIRGMVQAYDDPYTLFVAPAQHELESDALQGSFGGIGVRINHDADGNWVLFPFPDSPALQAGVQEGDRLTGVDKLTISGATALDDIQSAIRGPVNSKVVLSIARPPDFQEQRLSIRRAQIPLPSVTWHLDPDEPKVGVMEINLIAASTADEIQKAVKDLQARGAADYILDLRNNPGGLLSAGVEVARLFLKSGEVLQQQYRSREVETFRVERPGPLADLPLAVLINHGSASAAEIIAGALQAHQRALLVGSPSYGKDTVQLVFDLPDGSSLHVTAAHWWIPGLKPPIAGIGLQPDLPVSPPEANSPAGPDETLQVAVQALLSGAK